MLLTLKKMFFFGKNSFPAKLFCMIAVKKRKRNLLLESDFVPRMRRSSALSRFPPTLLKGGEQEPAYSGTPFFPFFISLISFIFRANKGCDEINTGFSFFD